jgi:hypothetical protein
MAKTAQTRHSQPRKHLTEYQFFSQDRSNFHASESAGSARPPYWPSAPWDLNVGCRGWNGRTGGVPRTSACSQKATLRRHQTKNVHPTEDGSEPHGMPAASRLD